MRVLLDRGPFQGSRVLRERNWAPLAVAPAPIDAVVLSHAQLDQRGWLPVLVREGFRGPVCASPATRDLAEVLLLESAHLQKKDARRANRGGWSRHRPALPLCTVDDVRRAVAKTGPVDSGEPVSVGGVQVMLTPAGATCWARAARPSSPTAARSSTRATSAATTTC